jgi:TolB-like protein
MILLFFGFLANCASTNSNRSAGLDTTINNAATAIKNDLPRGTKVAVVNFASPSVEFSEYVIEELSLALTGGKKLVVVDRRQLDLVRNELNFHLSGEVDDNSMSSIGRILGAQFIITGSFADAGTFYRFRVSAVNVENASREAPVSLRINKSDKQMAYFFPNTSHQNSSVSAGTSAGTSSARTSNVQVHSFRIKNSTGISGYELHIRQTGNNSWSEDLFDLGNKVTIISNGSLEIVVLDTPINGANRYDLKLVSSYSDGKKEYIKRNIQISPDNLIDFTRSDLVN